MITDRELARYISNNLHLYLADEDKPVECKTDFIQRCTC